MREKRYQTVTTKKKKSVSCIKTTKITKKMEKDFLKSLWNHYEYACHKYAEHEHKKWTGEPIMFYNSMIFMLSDKIQSIDKKSLKRLQSLFLKITGATKKYFKTADDANVTILLTDTPTGVRSELRMNPVPLNDKFDDFSGAQKLGSMLMYYIRPSQKYEGAKSP